MGAGNGAVVVISDAVKALHDSVFARGPQYKHYTIHKKYMVAVVQKPKPGILIYEFERSIKPLMRTVVDDDGGVRTIIRDFFRIEDGIWVLQHLDRIVFNQSCKARGLRAGIPPNDYKGIIPPGPYDRQNPTIGGDDPTTLMQAGTRRVVTADTPLGRILTKALTLNDQGKVVLSSVEIPMTATLPTE